MNTGNFQTESDYVYWTTLPCTEATEADGADEAEDMPSGRQLEATALIPPTNIDDHPTIPPESSASFLPSRPTRVRRPPAWMHEWHFVTMCRC